MADYVIHNDMERLIAYVTFCGDVRLHEVEEAYVTLMRRADLTVLHRFLWDYRNAGLASLTDHDLYVLALATNGRHAHNGQAIADAIVVSDEADREKMERWRTLSQREAGVADRVFTDYHEAVAWLSSHRITEPLR